MSAESRPGSARAAWLDGWKEACLAKMGCEQPYQRVVHDRLRQSRGITQLRGIDLRSIVATEDDERHTWACNAAAIGRVVSP